VKLTEHQTGEDWLLSQPINEMANLNPASTGLPVVIWVGVVGGHHGPRIKVSNLRGKFAADDCFVVAVAREPFVATPRSVKLKQDDVDEVIDWIKLNYDVLMELYQSHETGDGDTIEIQSRLKKL
jgi:hypothetical protein